MGRWQTGSTMNSCNTEWKDIKQELEYLWGGVLVSGFILVMMITWNDLNLSTKNCIKTKKTEAIEVENIDMYHHSLIEEFHCRQ
jgi:hypothetical protein